MKTKLPNFPNRESRFLSASVEIRAADDTEASPTVRGYAAKFSTESEMLGNREKQFREVIEPGAFDDVLGDDIRALFNHDPNQILARSKGGEGSLRVGTDEVGLWYEFELPDTTAGRDLRESLSRGDIDQSSFGFTVDADKWEERDNILVRTINKVRQLFDVSPVTYPAYPDATVALRSLEEFREEETPAPTPEEPTENHSIAHRQRALDLIDKTAKSTQPE